MAVTRIKYCQFLLSSQINYTMTNFANHGDGFSHDAVNRLLRNDKLTGKMIWEHAKGDIIQSPDGCLVFDDSVLDKNHSRKIELVRRQYSGNAHGLIKGVGMVNCLYINPQNGQYWIVDYRIFNPEDDGKTKMDHVQEMLAAVVAEKILAFKFVLFDSWYASKNMMIFVESIGKYYYCPLKENRLVDDSNAQRAYVHVTKLQWSEQEIMNGKMIKIRGFPKEHKVKLFRVVDANNRTDWVVTNDPAKNSTQDVQKACALRWKIEQFHRELKQLTGVEKCQARKSRIQRNHIACAVLVWLRLTALARKACTTVYKIKHEMLADYLRKELRSPSVPMRFA